MLYLSTDCLCRGGAPVQNLSHSACFHDGDNIAPSNSGTEHLMCLGLEGAVLLISREILRRARRSQVRTSL